MIKLTINPDTDPRLLSFDKETIIIGYGSPEEVDLPIENPALKKCHVKITFEGEHLFAINAANDPFVSVNGLPFGKKQLHKNYQLEIGDIQIRVDEATLYQLQENSLPSQDADDLPAKSPSHTKEKQVVIPFVQEIAEEATPPAFSAPPELKTSGEEEPEHTGEQQTASPLAAETRLKIAASIGISGLVFGLIAGTLFYLTASGQSGLEEIRAARSVADISMGFLHAQFSHLRSPRQHWSATKFINKSIQEVLPPKAAAFADLDVQGNFKNCPYLLRIYTSNDLSRFLVIAQPEPSLLQWLAPKASIVVDSESMMLHKTTNLKALNRLIVSSNTIDEVNAPFIASFVEETELIPLASLATSNEPDFHIPDILSETLPDAKNRIYNAPRYYLFGEQFISEAIELLENPKSSSEVTVLQQDMEALSQLPDLILYSPQGPEGAMKAHQAFSTFVPYSRFTIGYLNFSSQGLIASSHLFTSPHTAEGALTFNASDIHPDLLLASIPKKIQLQQNGSPEDQLPEAEANPNLDPKHPLYLQLTALATAREKALAPIAKEMIPLIEKQTQELVPHFKKKMRELSFQYNKVSEEQQDNITVGLSHLYQEYANIPLDKFMEYTRATKLESFVLTMLEQQAAEMGDNEILARGQVDTQLQKIEDARNLEQLERVVNETASLLHLERLPQPELLIALQHKMRLQVLDKLNALLLEPNTPLDSSHISESNHKRLQHILETSWVNDPDELEFYLTEFQLLGGGK